MAQLNPAALPLPPLAILVAVNCMTPGPAQGRRYIDNLVIR